MSHRQPRLIEIDFLTLSVPYGLEHQPALIGQYVARGFQILWKFVRKVLRHTRTSRDLQYYQLIKMLLEELEPM